MGLEVRPTAYMWSYVFGVVKHPALLVFNISGWTYDVHVMFMFCSWIKEKGQGRWVM